MSDEKRETVSDIVAQMRGRGEDGRMDMWLWRQYADRIEEAWKRGKAEIEADALAVGGIVEAARRREATTEKSSAVGNVAACKKRDEVVLRLSKEEYKGMQEALSEHDRLCEMLSESHKSVGNAAAMREALVKIRRELNTYCNDCTLPDRMTEDPPDYTCLRDSLLEIERIVDAALSAPARNCDVGTAEEQFKRYLAFCHSESRGCEHCPANKTRLRGTSNCDLAWAQMPYEADKKGEVDDTNG